MATTLPSNAQLISELLKIPENELPQQTDFIRELVGKLQGQSFRVRKTVIADADQSQLEQWWASLEQEANKKQEQATRERRGAKPKCVAAFDFDQNLIGSHCTSDKVANVEKIKERVWSDSREEPTSFTRLNKIQDTFGKLTEAGCKVVVITRNLKEYVDKALVAASLEVMEVVGEKEFDNDEKTAPKGAWLRANLLEPWGFQAPFKEVIFSDDTAENTEEVATSLPGAMIVQPTDGYCSGEGNQPFIGECQDCKNTRGCPHGLSMAEFDNIIAWASIQKNS